MDIPEDKERIKSIVSRYKDLKGGLIEALHAVQREFRNYFAEPVLREVAVQLGLPLAKVYGVATFYTLFSTKPRGVHIIRMCESAPCYIKGAKEVLEAVKKEQIKILKDNDVIDLMPPPAGG